MNYQIGDNIFGDWKIISELGEGGYGRVFELQKNEYGITTKSALKTMRIPKSESDVRTVLSEGMDKESVTQMFQEVVDDLVKEIAIMTTLKSHPNIVRYEDHKVQKDLSGIGWDILIRMELLQPLNQYVSSKEVSEDDVIQIGIDIGNAIAYCERKGLIHRDIKPENIFVDELGIFKLGDFGIARTVEKTTGGLSRKGTELYMAPEVYLGKTYDSTVDIYSLGLVLYKLLNGGRLPFYPRDKKTLSFIDREQAVSMRIRGEKIEAPRFASDEISKIILKACAYEPSQRYQDAASLLNDLKALQNSKVSQTKDKENNEKGAIIEEEYDWHQNTFSRTTPISGYSSQGGQSEENSNSSSSEINEDSVYGQKSEDYDNSSSRVQKEEYTFSENTSPIGGNYSRENDKESDFTKEYTTENIKYTNTPIVEMNRTKREKPSFIPAPNNSKKSFRFGTEFKKNKNKLRLYAVLSIIGMIITIPVYEKWELHVVIDVSTTLSLWNLLYKLSRLPIVFCICIFDICAFVVHKNIIIKIMISLSIVIGMFAFLLSVFWIRFSLIIIIRYVVVLMAFILFIRSFLVFKWIELK